MEFVFLLGRLIFGGYFVMQGINHFVQKRSLSEYARAKHVASPELAVSLSGALLVASGLCIVLGIFVDIALLALVVFLFITSVVMHAFWKDTDPMMKMNNHINFMKNMALLGASLMMLSIESWPLTF
jgi:putative oxidoreductase